jgi:hypothetical protein
MRDTLNTNFNLRIKKSELRVLRRLAKEKRITISQVIRNAIRIYMGE